MIIVGQPNRRGHFDATEILIKGQPTKKCHVDASKVPELIIDIGSRGAAATPA